MSIATEIQRIQTAKTNLITDLNDSGFDVPQSTLINNVVTTVNDDVLPLIDNRYDTFLSISVDDASVGDPIIVTVHINEEASGSINFNIGGWFNGSALIRGGKAKLQVETEFSGSVATVGKNLISVSYDGDSNYKPAMDTAVVTISKQHSSIAITEAIVDGDTLIINFSGGTSDIGDYCESFNIGEYPWQTGCVVIFLDGNPMGIANLTDGRGGCYYYIGNYESGTCQIQVAFLGDNKYELSVSDPVNITIPSRIPYLAFNITSGGTIVWAANDTAFTKTISYSKDNGATWADITSTTAGTSFNVNAGDRVMFKGDNAAYCNNSYRFNSFSGSTAGFEVEGNIMSLIDSTGFTTATTLTSAYTFFGLFMGCTGLTSAENLVLPATTLADSCYCNMFYQCTALTTAPELPATTLASNCYQGMFQRCTNLTTAPELPATTLADSCYRSMFQNCTSLTTAPELPATTLTENCYYYMFNVCTSLSSIKCLATNISASGCTSGWVNNVAASGTFTKAASMSSWTRGASGIPIGWTVQDAS